MRIEVKQGERGAWRWIVRDGLGVALFLQPVRSGHRRPEDALTDTRGVLYRLVSDMLRKNWWARFAVRDAVIHRVVESIPHDVIARTEGEG